jgi:hypothetical protein
MTNEIAIHMPVIAPVFAPPKKNLANDSQNISTPSCVLRSFYITAERAFGSLMGRNVSISAGYVR